MTLAGTLRDTPRSLEEISALIAVYPPGWRRWCNGPENGGCACLGCVRHPAPSTVRGDPEYAAWPDETDALSEEEVVTWSAANPDDVPVRPPLVLMGNNHLMKNYFETPAKGFTYEGRTHNDATIIGGATEWKFESGTFYPINTVRHKFASGSVQDFTAKEWSSDPCNLTFSHTGKQVFKNDQHFADAASVEVAAEIVDAMNRRV